MISIQGISATARYEFSRSLTISRLGNVLLLALFPPSILTIMSMGTRGQEVWLAMSATLFVSAILSNLLWATPVVSNELEGRSWIFVTSRHRGRVNMLLGKAIVAYFWTSVVLIAGTTGCIIVYGQAFRAPVLSGLFVDWLNITGIVLIGSYAYSCLFTLIGTVFQRRAMMLAMVYALVFEIAIANVPAVINQITVSSHLLAMMLLIFAPNIVARVPRFMELMDGKTVFQEAIVAVLLGTFFLVAACVVVKVREYLTTEEN